MSSTISIKSITSQSSASAKNATPKLSERLTEELVIALVGPVGSGCTKTTEILSDIFEKDYGYETRYYKLSEIITHSASLISQSISENEEQHTDNRVEKLQEIGDNLRCQFGNNYLAAKAVELIAQDRHEDGFDETIEGNQVTKKLRRVHIIDSLKHPEELNLLRSTYGEIFWLIGVFAPYSIRENRLRYHQKWNERSINRLIENDYLEDEDHGQKVRDVFHQADFFIRNDQENTNLLKKSIERFLEILFGNTIHTPTKDEASMYSAYAEASKSACLSRQVGAAILSSTGELIGLGRNDVPKFGGGLYSEDDGDHDHRCHGWQDNRCHNDKKKEDLYTQIFEKLKSADLLGTAASKADVISKLKSTELRSLIEYSRAVHAEMDAITSVARTHKAGLSGGTLYSTTFPCHSCARHIVASGIHKVFFIEPYPKSLAKELHSDAVSDTEADEGHKVLFLQYTGISPRNILKLFKTSLKRKSEDGKLKQFDKRTASPVVAISLDDYSTHEKWVIA